MGIRLDWRHLSRPFHSLALSSPLAVGHQAGLVAPKVTFSVTAALDQYVEAHASIHEPDGHLHPSALFGCDRKTVYEMRSTPETNPRDARSKRTLFVGTKWHEIVQAALLEGIAPRVAAELLAEIRANVDECYIEVPIEVPELNIAGHADALVRIGDQWELIEIKSISSMGFNYGIPKPEHIMQAATYMMGIRDHGATVTRIGLPLVISPLGDKLDRIRMVYVSKDDLRIHEEFVEWSAQREQEIRDRATTVAEYIADPLSLPPRMPFGKPTKTNPTGRYWLCGYCPFLDKCYDHDPDEVLPDPDVW